MIVEIPNSQFPVRREFGTSEARGGRERSRTPLRSYWSSTKRHSYPIACLLERVPMVVKSKCVFQVVFRPLLALPATFDGDFPWELSLGDRQVTLWLMLRVFPGSFATTVFVVQQTWQRLVPLASSPCAGRSRPHPILWRSTR